MLSSLIVLEELVYALYDTFNSLLIVRNLAQPHETESQETTTLCIKNTVISVYNSITVNIRVIIDFTQEKMVKEGKFASFISACCDRSRFVTNANAPNSIPIHWNSILPIV